ncbi:hypothetical protein [Maribellus maritimus]|uniref:hypothetical protein n=1 Tax=Maribellus maritimus TaxID=2870838 RepID=UPI001EEC9C91|nr:hypothetical protein [Maribellus maritimus]MCG6191257.1 hypothetical protein [Maribellus maritimus]
MKRFLLLSVLCLSVVVLQAQKLDINLMNDLKLRKIGPAGMSDRVTALEVYLANTNIIYAGTELSGNHDKGRNQHFLNMR